MTATIPSLPASTAPAPDPLTDTVRHEYLAEALNALLAETENTEGRLPLALNEHGQWCTRGLSGWRPHASYMHAYVAAHAEEVA